MSQPLAWGNSLASALAAAPNKLPVNSIFDPTQRRGSLYCELFYCVRDEAPAYSALSYTWGEDEDGFVKQEIYLKHKEQDDYASTNVTRNLRAALEHLQESQEEVLFWVDALCINQADVDEKSGQVRNMTDIYKKAACTLVWLGPAADDSDLAMEEVRKIGAHIDMHNGLSLFFHLAEISSGHDKELYDTTEKPVYNLMEGFLVSALRGEFPITSFTKLLSRRYWTRMWIWQEFVAASDVKIVCGRARVPFSYFQGALLFLPLLRIHVVSTLVTEIEENTPSRDFDMIPYVLDTSQSIPMGASQLCGLRRRLQKDIGDEYGTLVRLLAKAHVGAITNAGDPRDKIFALLGIAADSGSLGIDLNYAKSVTTVYTEAARAIIASGEVDLLSLCQFPKNVEGKDLRSSQLPTWVPDWCVTTDTPGAPSDKLPLEIHTPSGQLPWDTFFNASKSYKSPPVSVEDVLDMSKLGLQGCKVDVIEATKEAWKPGPDGCTTNTMGVGEYVLGILNLCILAREKLKGSVSSEGRNYFDPERDHFRIPIADQEQYEVGFIRNATLEWSFIGQQEVVDDIKKFRAQGTVENNNLQKLSYYNMMGKQRDRRPFITTGGFVGLGPEWTQEGDVVFIILGAKFPYILRRNADGTFNLVGEAFVQGIMYGEFMNSDMKIEDIILK